LNSEAQAAGNDRNLKFLRLARNSSKNLMRLIEDMLDVAKLEHGKLRPIPADVSVKSLLESATRDFEAQAAAEKKILSLRCPDGLRAVCDEALMRRVVANLVSNAMKHTKNDEGVIEVEAKSDGSFWTLTVSDNGMGVPEEYLSKIFDKFVQAEGRRFQIRSGAGLGLTFSKMAAEAHGGGISAASREGKGSSFSVKLPLRPPTEEHR
jgi:signal transduction histidine kinase